MTGGRLNAGGVIGADGIRSTVRRYLPREGGPVYRGYAIYRALIPVEGMPEELLDDCVCLWLCPGGHVVHYPVRGGQAMNIVAVTDSPWNSERWSEPALRDELDPSVCALLRCSACSDVAPADLDEMGGRRSRAEPDLVARPASRSSAMPHTPTLPFLAQGAAMSLEDAVVLARTLRRNGIADGFELYVRLRYERTRRLTLASRKAGWHYHLDGLGPETPQRDAQGDVAQTGSSTGCRGFTATIRWPTEAAAKSPQCLHAAPYLR